MSVRQFCKEHGPTLRIFPGEYEYQLVRKLGPRQFETIRGTGLLRNGSDNLEHDLEEVDPNRCVLDTENVGTVVIKIKEIRVRGTAIDIVCIEIK